MRSKRAGCKQLKRFRIFCRCTNEVYVSLTSFRDNVIFSGDHYYPNILPSTKKYESLSLPVSASHSIHVGRALRPSARDTTLSRPCGATQSYLSFLYPQRISLVTMNLCEYFVRFNFLFLRGTACPPVPEDDWPGRGARGHDATETLRLNVK